MRARTVLLTVLALAVLPLAGCVSPGSQVAPSSVGSGLPVHVPALDLNGTMTFAENVVAPAVHLGHGLYEPTIEVSNDGTIYATAHTTGVDDMGAPAYVSTDDGATWRQMPFAGNASLPSPAQGATPPPSDEIYIVAGDHGQAWGVDISLATFYVNGWCNDGSSHCYWNPAAYDLMGEQQARVNAVTASNSSCVVTNLNDRPWDAYANGTLLMVNNAGGGPVQVGVMKVPPPAQIGVWNPVQGPRWNLCAGEGGGSIPGIPTLAPDGFFAVPQVQGDKQVLVTGNAADVMNVTQVTVFENSNVPASQIINSGQATFDANGTLFVSAMDNTANVTGPGVGGIHLAVSQDKGASFAVHDFRFDQPVSSVFIDGNHHGPGAVISWSLVDGQNGTDWYLGHLLVGPDGQPVIRDATLALHDGPAASRHVDGSAVGPDGRAYLIVSDVSGNNDTQMVEQAGISPLHVIVQKMGPTLPVWAGTTW